MRIFMFASRYPVPFKPYYDTQFADLVRRGHELTVFSMGALDRDTVNQKVRRYDLDERTRRVPAYLRTLPLAAHSYLKGGLRRPRASLRAAREMRRNWNGRPLKEKILELARMIAVNTADPDVCFVHGLGTAVRFRWLKDAFPDTPVAMYYHGGEVPSVRALSPDLATKTFEAFDTVFTNTEFSRDHAVGRGCPEEKLHILPVGFDLNDFDLPEEPTKTRGGPLRLLSAGRMSEEKGHLYALEALERLVAEGMDDFVYDVTGEGYLRADLEAFVEERGLEEHVRFLGTLTTKGVMDAMRAADVLLLPSIQVGNWVENQAAAVQEAMLHRCLAVTTRTGGVPESIPECMRPFSVPEKDVEALTEVLKKIYRLGAEEREELAEQCREFVVENYDIRKLNDRMLSILSEDTELDGERARTPVP